MKHVADAIVYVANLPTNVQVLQMNIMYVPRTLLPYEHHFFSFSQTVQNTSDIFFINLLMVYACR